MSSTAIDTWWETSDPARPISQFLRCYSPADLALLLTGTGLSLTGIAVDDDLLAPSSHPRLDDLLRRDHEYLAVLHPDRPRISGDRRGFVFPSGSVGDGGSGRR